MAPDQKKPQGLNAWIGFLDESGFSQRPPVRATWAPRGQTPVLVEPFNWKTLSAIGLVLTTPSASRLRWLWAFHRGSIRSAHIVRFLQALRRHRRKKVLLLWDRLPAHRSRIVQRALERHRTWLILEWLPPYAPELNPVEPLWDYIDDTTLANTPMDDLGRLRCRARTAMRRLQRKPSTSRGFLKHTGLF